MNSLAQKSCRDLPSQNSSTDSMENYLSSSVDQPLAASNVESDDDDDVADSFKRPPAQSAQKPKNGVVRNGCVRNARDNLESVIDLVTIKETAVKLGLDITQYFTSKDSPPPPLCPQAKTLRRTAELISTRHEIVFSSMVKKLRLGEEGTSAASITSVANEMFCDNQINWGRVITLYTFAGWLARSCVENGCEKSWVPLIGETVGKYVADNLSDWVARQGGWEDMEVFFPEQDNLESKILKGLLYTVLGLGAVASTVAVVR